MNILTEINRVKSSPRSLSRGDVRSFDLAQKVSSLKLANLHQFSGNSCRESDSNRNPLIRSVLLELDDIFGDSLRSSHLVKINCSIAENPLNLLPYFHRAVLFFDHSLIQADEQFFCKNYDVLKDLETCLKIDSKFAEAYYLEAMMFEDDWIESNSVVEKLTKAISLYDKALYLGRYRIGEYCFGRIVQLNMLLDQINLSAA
jgi:hypothetical protein